MQQKVFDALSALLELNTTCKLEEIEAYLGTMDTERGEVLRALNTLKAEGKIDFPDRGRNTRSRYALASQGSAVKESALVFSALNWLPPQSSTLPSGGTNQLVVGDAYLRNLMVGRAPCFGQFEGGHPECSKCALAYSCGQLRANQIATIAAALDAGQEAPIVETPVVRVAEPEPEPEEEEIPEGAATMEHEIICSHCLEAIPAGTPYFPKIGEGCFHIHCPQTAQTL